MKRLFRDTEAKVQAMTKPLGQIGRAIVQASQTCQEKLKPSLNITDTKEKQQAEIYIFYEFLYFFMHLTMRSAFSQMTEQQIRCLQGYLGPLICSTAVGSFFDHWPENLKEGLRSDFYTKLNDAEREYSACKELLSEKPFTGNSLFSKLARNVAELSAQPMNPVIITLVITLAVDAYKRMNLDSLVSEAGKVLTPAACNDLATLPPSY